MTIASFLGDARSVITLFSFLSFVGIVFWAYNARRTDGFREAANIPFAEDVTPDAKCDAAPGNSREMGHG